MTCDLDVFLSAFFPTQSEPIFFRAFKPKNAPDTDGNSPRNLTSSREHLADQGTRALEAMNNHRGIYFIPNSGGNSDSEIQRFNAVFVENDQLSIEEQHAILDASPLRTSIRIETKKSVHAYWLIKGGSSADEWREVQKRLIHYFKSDPAIKNPSRLMRLPGFMHLTDVASNANNYEKVVVEVIQLDSQCRYSIHELMVAFPQVQSANREEPSGKMENIIGNGHRNSELCSIGGGLRARGLGHSEIFACLLAVNDERVRPPLERDEIEKIVGSLMRYQFGSRPVQDDASGGDGHIVANHRLPHLGDAALYGLAGEFVSTLEPHTEADPAAILVQLMIGFGSMIGKSAYFKVESDRHYTKLNAVLVGASSKARKGTSWGHVRNVLSMADESFAECFVDGLSSGEGLISHVRDEETKEVGVKDKGRVIGYQKLVVDRGAKDKRVLVVEPEFARVLRVMKRESSTISSVLRQAWDSDRLRIMTKTPMVASGTHISIIGHTTKTELIRNLDETETSNGFANRFLWVFTRRSKCLPFGGSLNESELAPFAAKLSDAALFAQEVGELRFSTAATELWRKVYEDLSKGRGGLLGSVTSRAEAQVVRIASVYALLDKSSVIEIEHLHAALSLWQYCEDSARYIFGENSGDRIADKISDSLKAKPEGLTRTDLRDLFSKNQPSSRIDAALNTLIEMGRIDFEKVSTGGRPSDVFTERRYDKNDINDNTP